MPAKKSQIAIYMDEDLKAKIKTIADSKGISISKYALNLIVEQIEEDEILRKRAPFMNLVSLMDNGVLLRDTKLNNYVEVIVKPDAKYGLYCMECESEDCPHVGFALAIKEVHKKLIERGVIKQT